MDADIGVQHLELLMMKGEKAHSGFPEISYGKYATALISQGFRVARVEQTETPEQMKDRNDSASKGVKKDKVVLREMCSILSRGTRTYSHLDDMSLLNESASELSSMNVQDKYELPAESILMCIQEKQLNDSYNQNELEVPPAVEFGICCVDTVLGNFVFAQFHDDKQRNRLRTMLAQFNPSEILLKHNRVSQSTVGAIRLLCPKVAYEYLRGKESPTSAETLKIIKENEYYSKNRDDLSSWPAIVQSIVAHSSNVVKNGVEASTDLVLSAFGGIIWQLQRSLIDVQLITQQKCYGYAPPDLKTNENEQLSIDIRSKDLENSVTPSISSCNTSKDQMESVNSEHTVKYMTLDAVALANLEVLVNNYDKTSRGSLWNFINRTKTPFGKRLLYQWLCKPLFRAADIQFRVEAVDDLITNMSVEMGRCQGFLKVLPDLERLLNRIHTNGNKQKSMEHPDSRAVFFEASTYTTRKIKEFADVLTGFETMLKIIDIFKSGCSNIKSLQLYRITQCATNNESVDGFVGMFPYNELQALLTYYRSIFDEKQAKRD